MGSLVYPCEGLYTEAVTATRDKLHQGVPFHHAFADDATPPPKFKGLIIYGVNQIHARARADFDRVKNDLSKIVLPNDWLKTTAVDKANTQSHKISGEDVKEELRKYVNKANALWNEEFGPEQLFITEDEAKKIERTKPGSTESWHIGVKKAFGEEDEEDSVYADKAHGALRNVLGQLLLKPDNEAEIKVERSVGRVIQPFFITSSCHLLSNQILVSPYCLSPTAMPDLATRVGIPRASLLAPVVFVADAKKETSSASSDLPPDVVAQIACSIQPTLQFFIMHFIQGLAEPDSKKLAAKLNNGLVDLPEWMKVYALDYTQESVRVWVYYPCYRIIGGTVRWGYVCSSVDLTVQKMFTRMSLHPRMLLLKLLLTAKATAYSLGGMLIEQKPLKYPEELLRLAESWPTSQRSAHEQVRTELK